MLRSALTLIICTSLFFSCQKEINEDVLPVLPTDSSTSLKSYIRFDSSLTATNDTALTARYSYDVLNRCTGIITTYFDNGTPSYAINENWFYAGSDTNVSNRIHVYLEDGLPPDTLKEYFNYDAAGKMIKDSIYEGNSVFSSFSFRNETNYTYTVARFLTTAGDTGMYNIHYYNKVNDNIILGRDSAYDYDSGSPSNLFSFAQSDFTYDNHPNPLYKVSIHWPDLFEFEHILQEEFTIQQKNNFLTVDQNFTAWSGPESYTYQYTYLANGYPSSVKMHDVAGNKWYRSIYIYQ